MAIRIYGNRAIATLPGDRTRPTPARVREALFNIWQGRIVGARWLDICAGSGAMGAEALCRGAASAVAIEKLGRACRIIEANWQKVKQDDQSIEVLRGEALRGLSDLEGEQFDAVYFDPPYASALYEPVLAAIARFDLLAEGGEVAVEHARDRRDFIDAPGAIERANEPIEFLSCHRTKTYGQTAVSFFRY